MKKKEILKHINNGKFIQTDKVKGGVILFNLEFQVEGGMLHRVDRRTFTACTSLVKKTCTFVNGVKQDNGFIPTLQEGVEVITHYYI